MAYEDTGGCELRKSFGMICFNVSPQNHICSHFQPQKINEEIMREREEEIKNIHKGMHQVNEIYKVN